MLSVPALCPPHEAALVRIHRLSMELLHAPGDVIVRWWNATLAALLMSPQSSCVWRAVRGGDRAIHGGADTVREPWGVTIRRDINGEHGTCVLAC